MDIAKKILLVEDDTSLAQWVSEYLVEQGFDVVLCHRGDEAVQAVKKHNPDLVLLDLMLPGKDGMSVCRDLRIFYHQPIIMMTAKGDEIDEVLGLEVGASDYVIKPVRPRVLLARINAVMREKQGGSDANSDEISIGSLQIDTLSRDVFLDGTKLALSNAEYSLLFYLASNADQILDRDSVFLATKGREYDGLDRSVDVLISALRKKIGDDPQSPNKIKTIWGKGYLFVSQAW
ncbi:MAG: response regulator [Pseudoalteromonas spongiae]|uniref:Response regulator n=1 Tax=Pseudoalteromonas spongiae TaxID=298657 RepID=A0ABU8EQ89_9GAMM|nr:MULTISPECIES: response regulator [Pseudoalteromonas]KPV97672.1 Transcriptional regulatory protein RstA [Pseudoalteromonas sp. P1-9]TMO83224.1 DNA-binding response regulator [Pseudoalteromonas spongiae]